MIRVPSQEAEKKSKRQINIALAQPGLYQECGSPPANRIIKQGHSAVYLSWADVQIRLSECDDNQPSAHIRSLMSRIG